ncbi:MAG: tetratricopeptide repeat protein [Steroidobacteraceae bacterium]
MSAHQARRLYLCAALWLVALCAPGVAAAVDIDYDPRRSAALRRCDDPLHHGLVERARECLRPLLRASDALTRAEAAFALDDLRTANDQFREAVAAEPRGVLPRLRWGRMFIAAGQYGEAVKLFQEALELDATDAGTRLALARVAAEQFSGDVTEEVDKLLAERPELLEAHLIASRLAVERGRYDDAVREAERASKLASDQRLPPLEALGLLAAIEVMRGRDPAAPIRDALAYNPRYGAMFEKLGYFEIMRRRYREADVWLQRAAQVQPDLWSARRELGLNLLRLGRASEARPHLEAAYSGDPFNANTVNTLRLLDSLNKFDVVSAAQPPMNLQLRKDETATLGPYVQQLVSSSISTFARRYGYTPDGPVTVELYPDHDDFAVRAAGLPGIGLLGVTFGPLVVMDSPSGRKSGDFHWGSTLWHEMAHVFTLGVTQHWVPRWLSEGLSVYEEWTTGPTPGVSVTPAVLDMFAQGKLLPIATLDNGFMRPSYEGQIQISYEQAGLTCLFAAERWGFPRVVSFLRAFDGKTTTEAAIRAVFQVEPAEFDRQFQAFMRSRFGTYAADPKRWQELMGRAHTMLESRNWVAARDAAQAAITMLPEFTASGSAYEVLAAAEEGASNNAAAMAAWLAWRKAGGWDPAGLRKLGALLIAADRKTEAAEVLNAVNYVDPLAVEGHAQLGELLVEQQRGADALREYQVLLGLQPLDTAGANFGLARAYRLAGDAARARRHLLQSLETAPNFRPAQRMLLEMTGDRTP